MRDVALSRYIIIVHIVIVLAACGGGGVYLVHGPLPTQDLHTYTNMEPETVKLSREEQKLVKLVMEHRASYGLPAIPISKSLTFVAKTHLLDLEKNKPVSRSCNGHSWSDKGSWSSCCYTGDHAQAKCMWDKPKELTNYPDSGFEIAFGADGNTMTQFSATAEVALAGWKSSRLHHNVILNRSMWKDVKWQAMGLAIYKTSACIWFGMKPDPAGSL